jgi:hypothetical protein
MVAALESAWTAIRTTQREIPAAVLVLGSGSPVKPSDGLRWGHFASLRWQHGQTRMPEVLVSGEGLNRGPVEVLTTLLHEAAHALADARGVKDTSRQGRWHNQRFAALAGELGLVASKDDKLGWSSCTMPASTQDTYRQVLDELGAALVAFRHPDELATRQRTSSNNGLALACACPRRIRVAGSVVEEGPIWCGVCDTAFATQEQQQAEWVARTRVTQGTMPDPGVVATFSYRTAPEGLATRRQLRQQGLRPGGQPVVARIVWRHGRRHADLFYIALARPKRTATPAQCAAVDKALAARRTCGKCGVVQSYYIPRRSRACHDCDPAEGSGR